MIARMWHGKVPVEKERYYPEDKDFLLELEANVTHFEVVEHSFEL